MTFNELYEMVKDLKDQKIPGDTEVFVYSPNSDDELVECTYVSPWEGEARKGDGRDRYIEIG